jgi:hypothetical protein
MSIPFEIGQQLPDIRLGSMGGTSVAFSDLQGRRAVVFVWGSWDPSRELLGAVEKFHLKHPEVATVSVACDAQGVDLPLRYLSAAKATHEIWMDATCVLSRRWKLKKVGVTLVLDEQRRLLFAGGPPKPAVLKEVEVVLGEKRKLKALPAPKVDTRDTQIEILCQACTNYLTRRRVDDAVGFLRKACEIDPENEIIPPQTWALRHPEKFYQGAVDVAWLKKQPRVAT